MKFFIYVVFAFIVFSTPHVCSLKANSRTVYYYPELEDECIDECVNGECLSVKRDVYKCSERFKGYLGTPCIEPCQYVPQQRVYMCRVAGDDYERCSLTKKRKRVQHFSVVPDLNKACISSCEHFSETYKSWCKTGWGRRDWEYCSREPGYGINDHKCLGPCIYYPLIKDSMCMIQINGFSESCGNVIDETVYSTIEIRYTGANIVSVNLQYDARELVNGQRVDKFIVINKTEPIHGSFIRNHNRYKRYVCRAGCSVQTLSATLTNMRGEYERQHLSNTHGIRRIALSWSPFAVTNNNAERNPIREAYVRDIGGGVSRVEFVEAEIHLTHYNPNNRIDFERADTNFMRSQAGVNGDHEAGHIVASVLGGPNQRYNLVPQHSAVNRNFESTVRASDYENDWYSVEQRMPHFFQHGEPGTRGGYIVWRVTVHYNSDTDYVPYMFQYLAQFYDENGREYDDVHWFPTGGGTFNRRYI